MSRKTLPLSLAVVGLCVIAANCLAQPPGDSMGDPTKLAQYLKGLDKNGDGTISPEEAGDRNSSRLLRFMARRANLNPDGPLSIAALTGGAKDSETKPGGPPPPTGGTPGFGGATGASSLDFIDRAESLIKSNDENKNGVLDGDEIGKLSSKYKGADINGDGTVTREELIAKVTEVVGKAGNVGSSAVSAAPPQNFGAPPAGTPGSSTSASPGSSGSSPPGAPGSSSSSGYGRGRFPGGDRSSSSGSSGPYGPSGSSGSRMRRPGEQGPGDGQRRSYRAKSPTERFPKGLPDWFARSDTDADGQVSMAEYSVTWNEAKAEEYARLDLNQDGFITVDEAVASVNGGKKPPTFVAGSQPQPMPTATPPAAPGVPPGTPGSAPGPTGPTPTAGPPGTPPTIPPGSPMPPAGAVPTPPTGAPNAPSVPVTPPAPGTPTGSATPPSSGPAPPGNVPPGGTPPTPPNAPSPN